jgi:cysteinyl-tRNA synthetase
MFPHHTNEIAQSEAYLGHEWCKYWFHVHHLNTNDGKMSKSKGEFLTVSLLEEKGYDPLVYRLFCLQSHYRKGLVFTWENLDNAAATYNKLLTRIAALGTEGEADAKAAKPYQEKFQKALDNDLNTSMAITSIYDVLKGKGLDDATKRYLLSDFDRVLGLNLLQGAEKLRRSAQTAAAGTQEYTITAPADAEPELAEEVNALLMERYQARQAKNWAESDRIRDELKSRGIELKDSKGGVNWTKS